MVGSLLSLVHGGFDLANVIHPPGQDLADLPNFADPRGLATFAITGLAYFVLARLMASFATTRGLRELARASGSSWSWTTWVA